MGVRTSIGIRTEWRRENVTGVQGARRQTAFEDEVRRMAEWADPQPGGPCGTVAEQHAAGDDRAAAAGGSVTLIAQETEMLTVRSCSWPTRG